MVSSDGSRASAATGVLVAGALAPGAPAAGPGAASASGESPTVQADHMIAEIYRAQYQSLVRLATLLLHDAHAAEEVVQEAFIAVYLGWRRLRDPGKALAYLRHAVVNRSRSELRHRAVVIRHAAKHIRDEPSAESGAMTLLERSSVIAAVRGLPGRQREAIVLRYYAGLSEAEIAATMGISKGAVKSHSARGMAALRSVLEQETLLSDGGPR